MAINLFEKQVEEVSPAAGILLKESDPAERSIQGIAVRAFASTGSGAVSSAPIKGVCLGETSLLESCNKAYRNLIGGLVGTLEAVYRRVWSLDEDETLSERIEWFASAVAFHSNTSLKLRALCREWGEDVEDIDSFVTALHNVHQCHSEYFESIFNREETPLYRIAGKGSLFFSLEGFPSGGSIYTLRHDLLTPAVEELEPFAALAGFVDCLDNIAKLQSYIEVFNKPLHEQVTTLRAMIERLTGTERETFDIAAAAIKSECGVKHAQFALCPTEADRLLLSKLSIGVRSFREAISMDLSKMAKQLKRCRFFLGELSHSGRGLSLNSPNGLPKLWPVVITNPFDKESIIFGRHSESRLFVDVDEDSVALKPYLEEARQLDYVQPSHIIGCIKLQARVLAFINLKNKVVLLTDLLGKYTRGGVLAEVIQAKISKLVVPN